MTQLGLTQRAVSRRTRGNSFRSLLFWSILPFLIWQLALGTSPFILAICVAIWAVSTLPFIVQGLNLYTILAISTSARYILVPMIVKSVMMQALEEHLSNPIGAYTISFIVVLLITAIILVAQRFDFGKALLTSPQEPDRLHRIAIYAFAIGGTAAVTAGITASRRVGLANPGPIFVLATAFSNMFVVSIAAEAMGNIKASAGTKILSPLLIFMLGSMLLLSLFLNVRIFLFYGILALTITSIIYRALTWKHIALGITFLMVFTLYVSPLMIVLRYKKEGKTAAEFAALCLETFGQSMTDPTYAQEAIARQHNLDILREGLTPVDYYGNANDMLNRFSFVGLADKAAVAHVDHSTIGWANYGESLLRVVPAFLSKDKAHPPYQHSDWVAWNQGIEPAGDAWAITYPEPLEGMAAFGYLGLFLSPFIFALPFLLIVTRVVSFKVLSPFSVALLPVVHLMLMEGNSDVYIATLTRTLPLFLIGSLCVLWLSKAPLKLVRHGQSRGGSRAVNAQDLRLRAAGYSPFAVSRLRSAQESSSPGTAE